MGYLRLPQKTTLSLLAFLFGVALLARYPRTPHELGLDGFIFHGMTESLIQQGHAAWIIHPLSYVGLYPLSHPSGSLFMLGSASLMGGLPVEGSILFYDFVLDGLAVAAAFALAMEVRREEGLGILVAGLFSLSPRIVTELLWEIPTRTSFTILVPIFVLLLLRWHRTRDTRWIMLVGPVLFLMMSAHRLTIMMAIILVAFMITIMVLVIAQTLRIRFASQVLGARFRRITHGVVLVGLLAGSAALLVLGGVLGAYQVGRGGFGSGVLAQVGNLGVSLARSAGLLIPLVPLGIVSLYQTRNKGAKEAFLLTILLVLIPTLSLRQYTGYYIIPFTALFSGFGLWALIRRLRRWSGRVAAAALGLGIAVVSSQLVVAFDLQFDPYIDQVSYTHATYLRYNTHGTIVSNDGSIGSKTYAISGRPYLPVGGATTAFQSPELLIFGFVDLSQRRIVPVPLSDLTVESDSPFQLQGVQAEADWAAILDHPVGSLPPRLQSTYNATYLLENWEANGGYLAYGKTYPSALITSAKEECYKVFELPGQTLWYIGDPN